jgi:hypothetical protein
MRSLINCCPQDPTRDTTTHLVPLKLVLIQLSQVELSQFRAPFFMSDTAAPRSSVKARG